MPDASSAKNSGAPTIEMEILKPWALARASDPSDRKEAVDVFVATVLAILSGLFYAAGHNEIGSFGVTMCQYGSPFCNNPILVPTGAALAALRGGFVSVR